jgi:SAM-dependent methyltransferase
MRIGVITENILERILLAINIIPTPLLDTQGAFQTARPIMTGAKLGIFEALAAGPLTTDEVAARCKTNPRATTKLLNALVGLRYLRFEGDRYALAPVSRKWLLKDSPSSVLDKVLHNYTEWEFIENLENFVSTGQTVRWHEVLSDEEWGVYQRGMRALVGFQAPEVARRTPVPEGARDMLDVGGSHGYLSVVLCKRHPGLRSVILDLPEAVKHAAPILAKEGMGDRVTHRVGDALKDDLGTEAWDLIFMANLVHHFDDATNRFLIQRAANALRPGGYLVILDVIRPSSPKQTGQAILLVDLYCANTSTSGAWSFEEMTAWEQAAGLQPMKPIRFLTVPGVGQQAAVKPK